MRNEPWVDHIRFSFSENYLGNRALTCKGKQSPSSDLRTTPMRKTLESSALGLQFSIDAYQVPVHRRRDGEGLPSPC